MAVYLYQKANGPQTEADIEEMRAISYRETVGALIWASIIKRPGIADAVCTMAKFCDKPGPAHWKVVSKVLQYLLWTQDQGLRWGGVQVGGLEMSAYMDSDHGTCLDSRRSVSGGKIKLAGGSIAPFSRMQHVVASSSPKAEHITLAEVVNEVLYLRQIKQCITPNKDEVPIKVDEDNQGGIQLANEPINSKRTPHIDVRHRHFIRDAVLETKVASTISGQKINTQRC